MPAAIQWWQKPALEELVEEHTRLMTRQVFSQATKVAELAISEYPESELARFMLVNTSLGELEARLSTIQFTCTVDDARPLSMPNAEEWNELTKRHAQKSSLRNQSHD